MLHLLQAAVGKKAYITRPVLKVCNTCSVEPELYHATCKLKLANRLHVWLQEEQGSLKVVL